MQNESFLRHVQPSPIPNASRTHPEGKRFPPKRTKTLSLVLYLIIYERVKNVAHLKKDA